jgi:hypothetical protein
MGRYALDWRITSFARLTGLELLTLGNGLVVCFAALRCMCLLGRTLIVRYSPSAPLIKIINGSKNTIEAMTRTKQLDLEFTGSTRFSTKRTQNL